MTCLPALMGNTIFCLKYTRVLWSWISYERGRLLIFRKEGRLENKFDLQFLRKNTHILLHARTKLSPSYFLWAVGKAYFVKCTLTVFVLWGRWDPAHWKNVLGENNRQEIQVPDEWESGNESTFLSCNRIRGVSHKNHTACFLSVSGTHLWDCSSKVQHGTFGEGKVAFLWEGREQVLWCTFYLHALVGSFWREEVLPTSHICSRALPQCKTSQGLQPSGQLAGSAHQPRASAWRQNDRRRLQGKY